ncbi:unnamed protein product [Staurois parvus]|uniref:Uncharacterized protein n=1 Tax=Staurois parvus TaxID=386267 RepID=A0ABN9EAS8_9NEOB|nr:unnamed protein product [Staurois parvus]
MYTDHQCSVMICIAPEVPTVSVHQCQLSVLSYATYQCLPVHINATYQCPSELPFSATYQCQSGLPISAAISAAYQCPSLQPLISTHQ